MRKLNKNTGITLISLVITIIIMLILVGVSINLAVNGGLFEYAGNAVGDTKNAMKNEQDLVNTIIDDYIKKYTGEKEHEWYIDEEGDGDTFKCKKHPEEIYTIGDRVDYTATPGTTTLDLRILGFTNTVLNAPETTELIVPVTAQTQDVIWRVLGIDEETGSLLITTDGGVGFFAEGEEFDDEELIDFPIYIDGNFGSVEGFNNGPSEMNRICKELYSNSEYGYAQSMTIENVDETLKHKQPGGLVYSWNQRKITYEYGFGKIKDIQKVSDSINSTPNGEDINECSVDGYLYSVSDDYSTLVDEEGTSFNEEITELEYYMIFGNGSTFYSYWLASRGKCFDLIDAFVSFGIGSVENGTASNANVVATTNWGNFNTAGAVDSIVKLGLRPVVYCNKSKLPKKVSSLYDDLGD